MVSIRQRLLEKGREKGVSLIFVFLRFFFPAPVSRMLDSADKLEGFVEL